MNKLLMTLILAGLLAVQAGCSQEQRPVDSGEPQYSYGEASADGTGKFFMGREISSVMGHLGSAWLERASRIEEERADVLLENLPLMPDSVVADIGAGTGYFTLPIAQRVDRGWVLAVDIQEQMIATIRQRMAATGIKNIEPILATEQSPNLPVGVVDLVLIVDAYHEFSYPLEVMRGVAASLKPDGRVYVVEYRGEVPQIPIKPLHKMTQEQVRRELAAAGLTWVETLYFLPRQHVLVFRRARG